MEKIVLFCKSYKGDIERFKIQAESVRNHNRDNIPFYICIPKSDKNLFDPIVKKCNIKVFFDEDISNLTSEQSHFTQQLFKIEFMRSSNVAKHYFLMDSDMYFIKDFSISDFFNNGVPYMTMHECKDLLEYSYLIHGDNRINEWFVGERKPIMELFGRKGKYYDYSGSANLYIADVFVRLYNDYCKPNNLNFLDLLKHCSSENTWYGEYALATNTPFYPCGPMFKTFHYPWQYKNHKQLGITMEMISKNYLGITMQSNWGSPLKY
jgi:hypothetical protein|tara:strand:+ start:4618 stop:5412 length:795 start_codon:yes stop_codon:yes gene_type:complete